ncbi:MAG: hypothetical protein Kow0074_13100 [Candidatus Zixiibacteriota bacterium]
MRSAVVASLLIVCLLPSATARAIDCDTLPPPAVVTLDSVATFQFGNLGGSDCWGWEGPDGTEYAIMGTDAGVSIVNATTLEFIQTVPGPMDGICGGVSWRDMVTYDHYCLCVSECTGTNQGMMIIDLQYLPDSVHFVKSYYTSGNQRSHNMCVDTATGYAYVMNSGGSGIRIISLADPENPVDVGFVPTGGLHDMYARNDTVWVAEANQHSFSIWDVSNKTAPVEIVSVGIPDAGYVHNIWPTLDGKHCVTTEETAEQTVKVWDVSNLQNVKMVSEFLAPSMLAHNAHVIGDYVVMSHYTSGVRIVDISVPECPREVAFFDTYTNSEGPSYDGAWGAFPFTRSGKVYASNGDGRLFILQSNLQIIDYAAGPTVGEPPLTVNFDDASFAPITDWSWDFGDGSNAAGPTAQHTYTNPGVYTVDMTVTIDGAPVVKSKPGLVAVISDTVNAVDTTLEADQFAVWDLYMTNNVPIDEITLPIRMTNVPTVMYLDSISFIGTRLEYFEKKQILINNPYNGQIVIRRVANNGGGSPPLAPGTGVIAKAYVRTRDTAVPGDTVHFGMEPVTIFDLECVTYGTSFKPEFNGATMTVTSCACESHGDVEDDGVLDAVDLNSLIDHVFFGLGQPIQDASCPHVDRGDVNCDGFDDAIDVNYMIEAVFFNGPPACDPCACSPYPSSCP